MKLFRHNNGFLYTIEQIGRGRTISPRFASSKSDDLSPPKDWKCFEAIPYKTNKNAPNNQIE